MRIDLKCCCGATASFDTPRGTYAEPGGNPVGPKQRRFRVEILADDWLDRHAGCKPMFAEAAPQGPEVSRG